MRFTATLGLVLPLIAAHGGSCRPHTGPQAAVYMLDNNPSGADIIAFSIASNGTVSGGVRTSTGGKGLVTITNPPFGGPLAPSLTDSLFSSGSVVVSGNYLFTINPGSNTVSVFWIDPENVTYPKLIGKPACTGGVFPQSVAYAPGINRACVLNGGTTAGVQCFSVDGRRGLTPVGGLRHITAVNQTNPPVGPVGSASQVVFNPSESALYAVIKGPNGMEAGYIYAYPVEKGAVSTKPIINRPADLPVPFSIDFLGSDSRAVVTDATFGVAIVDLSAGFELTVSHKQPVADQQADCWTLYSARYDTIFVTDGGQPNMTLISPSTGEVTGTIDDIASDLASFDFAEHNQFLYVMKGSPTLAVYDNTPITEGGVPTTLQRYDLSFLGKRDGFQGMAIYSA